MNLDKLDKVFSEYIRRRDSDTEGYAKCCTCPTTGHHKTFDAGHFISRGKLATRYDERNVHACCLVCNRLKDGNLAKYEIFMRSKYGPKVIKELRIKSHKTVKWMPHEIQEMIEELKSKIKEL